MTREPRIRPATAADRGPAYEVCLRTGDHGGDGTRLYREDPDALGRIFVGPYLALEPELSLVLEDADGVCGYALAALDSRDFYARYEREWRPSLAAGFPDPAGDPRDWSPEQHIYHGYHHPDYYCPEPYDWYPSHLHIDLLPRVQGSGHGRRMLLALFERLGDRGSPGVHLGVSPRNTRAGRFYGRMGFHELTRVGSPDDGCIYMGLRLQGSARSTPGDGLQEG